MAKRPATYISLFSKHAFVMTFLAFYDVYIVAVGNNLGIDVVVD